MYCLSKTLTPALGRPGISHLLCLHDVFYLEGSYSLGDSTVVAGVIAAEPVEEVFWLVPAVNLDDTRTIFLAVLAFVMVPISGGGFAQWAAVDDIETHLGFVKLTFVE